MPTATMYAWCSARFDINLKNSKNELKKCGNCLFQTYSKLHFLRHFCEVTKKGVQCHECYKILGSPYYLRMHIHHAHIPPDDRNWIKCELCDFRGLTAMSLTKHSLSKHLTEEEKSQMSHKCQLCDYQSIRKSCVRRHVMRKHSIDKKWQCKECDFKTTTKIYLKTHVRRRHTEVVKVQCDLCKGSFNKLDLKKHIAKVHTNKKTERVEKCDLCKKGFMGKEALDAHRHLDHQRDTKDWHHCPHCDYRTLNRGCMQGHLFRKHREGSKGIQCNYCDFQAFERAALKEHVLNKHTRHEDIDWFQCISCSYKAKTKGLLKRHEKRNICEAKRRRP